jgi:hypothetical protein
LCFGIKHADSVFFKWRKDYQGGDRALDLRNITPCQDLPEFCGQHFFSIGFRLLYSGLRNI